MRDFGWLPVVDSPDGQKFLGMVTRRDLLGAFDREALQRSRLFARVNRPGLPGRTMDYFELPEKHRLTEIDVPPECIGKTVAEAALRARFGVTVLAVKRLGRDGIERRFVPSAEDRLQRGDRLVLLASEESLARIEANA